MPWPKGRKLTKAEIARRVGPRVALGTRRKKPVLIEGIEYWRCGSCTIYKPAFEYYRNGKTASGISSQCRRCHLAGSIRTRDLQRSRATSSAYMRRARQRDPQKFRERERLAGKKKRERFAQRVTARNLLNSAVKRGEIQKPDRCSDCRQVAKITGHHEDYSKPLDVVWLCYGCHGRRHRSFERLKAAA